MCRVFLFEEEWDSMFLLFIEGGDFLLSDCVFLKVRKIWKGKCIYFKYIKELKLFSKKLKGFIVGDIIDW